jgi:hypothetical protein
MNPKHKRIIPIIFIFTLIIMMVSSSSISQTKADITTQKNVTITVIVYPNSTDAFVNWASSNFPTFHDFTIVVGAYLNTYTWLFENLTKYNSLTPYGEVIPLYGFSQDYPTAQRLIHLRDEVLTPWFEGIGEYPKGLFQFIPDTYTSNYLKTLGINYIIGYCFDQYLIDHMTMRGGWQLPYYASNYNALVPNNASFGTTIYPWMAWDWIDSFYNSHEIDTHPMDLLSEAEITNRTAYSLALIDASLNSITPIPYLNFGVEYDWLLTNATVMDEAEAIINSIVANTDYAKMRISEFDDLFRTVYHYTPSYSVNFTSPLSGDNIEWYYSQNYRIARINNTIVSYVDYRNQASDKYLTTYEPTNHTAPTTLTNTINTSLEFTIDDLGGGEYRAPIQNNSVVYIGTLSNYQLHTDLQYVFLPAIVGICIVFTLIGYAIKRVG